jgi:CheY-like chemotaxis protein
MNARIVVIDDNPANLKLLGNLLEYEGHTVVRATNARDGYHLVMAQRPDLILVDIEMPEVNGLWLVRLLRSQPETREIPTIAVTAFAMHADAIRVHDAGCDGYLTKPVDARRFAQQVAVFLPDRLKKKKATSPSLESRQEAPAV